MNCNHPGLEREMRPILDRTSQIGRDIALFESGVIIRQVSYRQTQKPS